MTGEMFKPKNADKGEDYWKDKTSAWGSVLGDDSFLIRPNYPDFFELRDKIRELSFKEADVEPFDVYQGPYIDLLGIDVGKSPYSPSLNVSKALGSCQIWRGRMPEEWALDCGVNNKKFFGTDKAYLGDEEIILEKLKELKKHFQR